MASSILQHIEDSNESEHDKALQMVAEHNQRMGKIPLIGIREDKTTVVYFPKKKDTPEYREHLIDKYKNLKHEWR